MTEVKDKNNESKKIVLVVEDDDFLVQAYQIKLGKENVEVWLATSGKEAVAFLDKEPPNIVLLDLLLPGLNGLEFLSMIRQKEPWKNVPVVILTNLSQSETMARAKELGAAEYIVKSETKIDEIVGKVKKYLHL